jgi:hypothetical protein
MELGEEWKQKQMEDIHEWWASLPEEDKTLALQIDFTQGDWEEQLDEIKANAIINTSSQKYDLDKDIIER